MLKKYKKRIFGTLALTLMLVSTFLNTGVMTFAESPLAGPSDVEVTTETTDATSSTSTTSLSNFVPFRSDYVKYITNNASQKSDVTQYVWLKLFNEELNWDASKPWYNSHFTSWSNMYYGDYIASDGSIKSSKDTQVTYNADFDGFLYQTINNNEEFVINWLNEQPGVFKNYAKTAANHTVFARAIIKLTESGLYLGGGKDSDTNVFLKGSASTASTKGNAAWSNNATDANTYDIDVLRIFGSRYSTLNDTQKAWVKTYMQWMVNDYETNGSNAVAAPNNSRDLYNLIATSSEGFNSTKAQEFFNYVNSSKDLHIGDLIVNSATAAGQQGNLYTGVEDIVANMDMSAIFDLSDADCNYTNSGWWGYRNVRDKDDDYDWLAYRICFDNSAYWTRLRNLIDGNTTTEAERREWLLRYYINGPSSSADPSGFKQAVANAGQTKGLASTQYIQPGCNRTATKNEGFQHAGHWGSGSVTFTKPVGVKSVSWGVSGKFHRTNYDYKIWDSATNRVLIDVSGSGNSSYSFAAKDTWSKTIQISVTCHTMSGAPDGNYENVGSGSCYMFPAGLDVNGTYTDISACERNGHIYNWTYKFFDANDKEIVNNSSIPSYCIAYGVCANCGDRVEIRSHSIKTTEYNKYVEYKATFKSGYTNLGSKTMIINKGSSASSVSTFSPSSHQSYLQTSGLVNYGKTMTISGVYTGNGNAVQFNTFVNGTVTLKAGAIQLGAKKVTVSATGTDNTYKLVSPIMGVIDEMRLNGHGNLSYTFDLSDYADEQLDGAYIVCNLSARDVNTGGHSLGERVSCTSTIQFNSITVTY